MAKCGRSDTKPKHHSWAEIAVQNRKGSNAEMVLDWATLLRTGLSYSLEGIACLPIQIALGFHWLKVQNRDPMYSVFNLFRESRIKIAAREGLFFCELGPLAWRSSSCLLQGSCLRNRPPKIPALTFGSICIVLWSAALIMLKFHSHWNIFEP